MIVAPLSGILSPGSPTPSTIASKPGKPAAGTVDRLPLRPYLATLAEALTALDGVLSGPISLNIDVADVELAPEIAAPLGLILNEFATNNRKYAFDGKGRTIVVRVKSGPDGGASAHFAEDGKGLPLDPARLAVDLVQE